MEIYTQYNSRFYPVKITIKYYGIVSFTVDVSPVNLFQGRCKIKLDAKINTA